MDFVAYGDPSGHSAMASTVGFTAAIVTKMVLNGKDAFLAFSTGAKGESLQERSETKVSSCR